MKRDFKGVWIPAELWLNENLTKMEMLLLIELDSLDNGQRGCYASNEYLAKFFRLSKSRISQIISSLEEKGYLSVILIYDEGKKSVKERQIKVFNILKGGIKYSKGGYLENCEDNNTSNNNTIDKTLPHPADADEQKTVNQNQKSKPAHQNEVIPASFARFWDHYPKKCDKKETLALWLKGNYDSMIEIIIADLINRTKYHQQWQDKKYIPSPARYLRREKWEDEIVGKELSPLEKLDKKLQEAMDKENNQHRGIETCTPKLI